MKRAVDQSIEANTVEKNFEVGQSKALVYCGRVYDLRGIAILAAERLLNRS